MNIGERGKSLLRDWTFIRAFRIVLGVAVIYSGVQMRDWFLLTLGVLFTAQGLFNMGCCAFSACNTGSHNTCSFDSGSKGLQKYETKELKL